ncbi:DinB family protein [Bacillus sp. FJAT-49736]|uniref:DinB family protein n=1 Tax=Bacillus sp. FJAT-49736 TaxID=2833582 RepID=UPI001BC99FE0|nr:DinB family protein [Bacillus sp. FJAT-49736]MBS4174691.1 DinB family protein [Bacillus sp. FJAT-49736]
MDNNTKAREEVLNSVRGLTDEQLNKRVEEGTWSIMQILQHLYLIERSITKGISNTLTSESEPAPAKPIERILNRSTKVNSPPFGVPSNEFVTLEEMEKKLAESRKALNQLTSSAKEADLESKSMPNPVFGRLSLKQYISFVGYHEQRHLQQIEEIKAALE